MRLSPITAVFLAAFSLLLTNPAIAACNPKTTGDQPAGSAKGDLNTLKNRTADPSSTEAVTVPDILGYPGEEDEAFEAKGVVLTGILLQRVHEGPESPNCKDPTREDYHIFIGATDPNHPLGKPLTKAAIKTRKKKSVVVELTPNIQDEHPDWAGNLSSLVGKEVCITGWLMFDPEHPLQLNKTRGTLWEVHPITGIGEVQSDGSCQEWQSLTRIRQTKSVTSNLPGGLRTMLLIAI